MNNGTIDFSTFGSIFIFYILFLTKGLLKQWHQDACLYANMLVNVISSQSIFIRRPLFSFSWRVPLPPRMTQRFSSHYPVIHHTAICMSNSISLNFSKIRNYFDRIFNWFQRKVYRTYDLICFINCFKP